MSFLVTAVYDDSKNVELIVPPDEIEQVHNCIAKGEFLSIFNKQTRVGIWAPMSKLRCVMVQIYAGPKKDDEKKEEVEVKEEEKEVA